MSINDFEKNVQQHMEEFKVSPSSEVWEKVELRIREKKKRRRIIFWLLFPGLLLGGGIVYWASTSGNQKTISADQKNLVTKKNEIKEKEQLLENKNENTVDLNSRGNIPASKNGRDKKSIVSQKNPTNKNLIAQKISDHKVVKKNVRNSVQKDITDPERVLAKDFTAQPENKDQGLFNSGDNNKNKEENKTVVTSVDKKTDSAVTVKAESTSEITQSKKDEGVARTTFAQDSSKTQNKKKKKNPKKMQWGFSVATGVSNTPNVSNFLNFSQVTYDASLQSGSVGGSGNSSKLRPGPLLAFNFFGQKKISDHLDLNFGIGYSYLSTVIKVGRQVNGPATVNNNFAVNNFYRPAAVDTEKNYINQYHLLDLEAFLSWRILKNKKYDLRWENGVGISRLLGSNALHYSTSLPGYYKNFDLFNKTHVFISTGLSLPLLSNEKLKITINPFLSYSLTPVLKNNDSLNTHFTNYGIRLKFFLTGKKTMQR